MSDKEMSLADYIKVCKKGGDRILKKKDENRIIDEETGEILRPSKRLKISNLNSITETKKLYEIFSGKGILIKCRVDKDKEGESLLKGIIEFEKLESANKVLEEFKDFEIDGSKIKLMPLAIRKNNKRGNKIKKRFNNTKGRRRSNRNRRN